MKQENRIYIRHQAFNKVYKEIKDKPKTRVDGFDAPKQYHHSSSKLDVFKDFSHYVRWASELHGSGNDLISQLETTYDKSTRATSSYYKFDSKKSLESILKELDDFHVDVECLRKDIREFQICMLATSINEKQAEIEALSDHLRQLSFLEDKIIETCNRKIFEINSSKMSFYSLLVASIAVVLSFFVIFTDRT